MHQYDGVSDWNEYMTYTGAYFGPNAFPVFEIQDATIPTKHQLELSADVFWGFGDQTQSLTPRFTYTVLPGKLAFSAWGVFAEHYKTTLEIRDQRASQIESAEGDVLLGDWYLSVIGTLYQETASMPAILLEVLLKTASSETASDARFFDTPGYSFNVHVGKSIQLDNGLFDECRVAGFAGFLSYQLNGHYQNDAPDYGGKIQFKTPAYYLETGMAGYNGWTKKGDCPLVMRAKMGYKRLNYHFFIQYQHALNDYPYRRIQTGITIDF